MYILSVFTFLDIIIYSRTLRMMLCDLCAFSNIEVGN